MYGYVRPVKSELRIREYEQFRAVYCGLCEALKRRCGFLARFVVNYDLTFMAMALSDYDGCMQKKRCPAHPFRRRYCLCGAASLDTAADYSVILAWWKLRDDIQDKTGLKRLVSRIALLLLRPAYRKAVVNNSQFDQVSRQCLVELEALEKQKSSSLDQTADCFARILAATAEAKSEPDRRIFRELFYHLGRYVYLLDAIDDLTDDWKSGSYNPLIYRFRLQNGQLGQKDRESLRNTLNLSQNCMASAFRLAATNPWTPILENIIYLGLPLAADKVLSGQWNKSEKGKESVPIKRRDEEI